MLRLTAINLVISICGHPSIENFTNMWNVKDSEVLAATVNECAQQNLLNTCVNRFRKVSDNVYSFTCRTP